MTGISKKAYKLLKPIAPYWAENLIGKPSLGTLNIFNNSMCIVGESHNFTSFYEDIDDVDFCHKCDQMAGKLANDYLYENMRTLSADIIDFALHHNEMHKEIRQ